MNPLHSNSKPIPAWQIERAGRLHQVCRCIKARVERGQSRYFAIQIFVLRWRGRPLKSNPQRHFMFNESTLYRHYRTWLGRGQTPEAFRLNLNPVNEGPPAACLARFVEFAAAHDFHSLKKACAAFRELTGSDGPGYRDGKLLQPSHDAIHRGLPSGCWRDLKTARANLQKATEALERLRRKFVAEIEARPPSPRRRMTFGPPQ